MIPLIRHDPHTGAGTGRFPKRVASARLPLRYSCLAYLLFGTGQDFEKSALNQAAFALDFSR